MKLFALDHSFPLPIVKALGPAIREAELVSVGNIHPDFPSLPDWRLLWALHAHPRPWDGLISTDHSMLNLGKAMAVLHDTRLTLVVTKSAGDDPLLATGMVLTHLPEVCRATVRTKAQVWSLQKNQRTPESAMKYMNKIGRSGSGDAETTDEHGRKVLQAERLSEEMLACDFDAVMRDWRQSLP